MPRMVSGKRPTVKTALRRMLKKTNDKRLSIRIRIVLMNFGGQKASLIAKTVVCSAKTVRRVVNRFVEQGIVGLHDRREDNGDLKLDEVYLGRLKELVDLTPQEFGYLRPSWTRELLVEVMAHETGTRIHPATMSRALKKIKCVAVVPVRRWAVRGQSGRKPEESISSSVFKKASNLARSSFTKMKSTFI